MLSWYDGGGIFARKTPNTRLAVKMLIPSVKNNLTPVKNNVAAVKNILLV